MIAYIVPKAVQTNFFIKSWFKFKKNYKERVLKQK